MLEEDVRNNSAWNQRWFVIENTSGVRSAFFAIAVIVQSANLPPRRGSVEQFTEDVISREIEFAFKQLEKAVSNESPWNYLRGCVAADCVSSRDTQSHTPRVKCCSLLRGQHSELVGEVEKRIADLISSNEHAPTAVHLHSLHADVLLGLGKADEAHKVFELLSTLDPARAKYWAWRLASISVVAPETSSRAGESAGAGEE